MPIIHCKICSKEKYYRPSYLKVKSGLFCSSKCYGIGKLGEKHSSKHIENFKLSMKGKFLNEENPMWKGDNVGYFALHKWISRKLGKPSKCEYCNKNGGNDRSYHWANISHKYKRNFSDWIRLCVSCHKNYDLKNVKTYA